MSGDAEVQRDLGRFEARLASGDVRMDRIEKKIDTLTEKLDALAGYANRAKGAWGLVLAVGSIGAGLVEGLRWLLHR
jgi:hypothetical protein